MDAQKIKLDTGTGPLSGYGGYYAPHPDAGKAEDVSRSLRTLFGDHKDSASSVSLKLTAKGSTVSITGAVSTEALRSLLRDHIPKLVKELSSVDSIDISGVKVDTSLVVQPDSAIGMAQPILPWES